jgi:dipeptidase D
MPSPIENLKPEAVWKYFGKICEIPHGSGNERALGEAVMTWARERGAEAERDAAGNVVVRIPATKGCEGAPIAVLQGHLDMVCEKNSDTAFDFEKDAISLVRDGDWLKADGTTLGADNGVGLAMGLAFLDGKRAHGPLEILCTVSEETGLDGARSLQPGFVRGRLLINLDSEEDGVFYVGCAGGRDCHTALPLAREPAPADRVGLALELKGLRGGHSGLDIVHNRGNATRLLARAILAASREVDLALVSIEGGDKHNAIPREARAVVAVAPADRAQVERILGEQLAGFRAEFASAEPELTLAVSATARPAQTLAGASGRAALALLTALPHGVIAMSRDIQGLVETSSNMARVRTEDGALTVLTSSRSSVASSLAGVIEQIQSIGALAGAKVEASDGYPGWQPNLKSELLALGRKTYARVHGLEPKFTAIHAGLECGILSEKYPGLDMISFGPTIQNPHSPDERVSIPTVERSFAFLEALVDEIAKKKG